MMRFLTLIIILVACDFSDDPISQIFQLSKNIVIPKENIIIDPAKSRRIYSIHFKLYQSLSKLAEITTVDSITWSIKLNKVRFSISPKKYVSTEDVFYSFNRNKTLFNYYFGINFSFLYRSYRKIDDKHCEFKFTRKVNFFEFARTPAFFIYSKSYSSLDIPIGTSSHMIAFKPTKKEYVIIPYIEFLHLQVKKIDTLYWLNTNIETIKQRKVNYDLPDLNRFILRKN